ncbi:MAG TPA: hypothetical protein VGR27_12790 [Longimicrobiaceae bacterium]|nr:hypothetical protein [Longimicrobiaceae bacterium]
MLTLSGAGRGAGSRYSAPLPASRGNFTGGDFYGPLLHFVNANLAHRLAGPLSLEANALLRRSRANQFNANFTEPDIRIASGIRSLECTAQLSYAAGALEVVGGMKYALNDVDLAIFQHPNPQYPARRRLLARRHSRLRDQRDQRHALRGGHPHPRCDRDHRSAPRPGEAGGVAVSPDGRRVYVANGHVNTVW